jgi:hypothetical protein
MDDIKIDFFELSFLAEACIPPVPIARYSFWMRLIDEIHDKLTKEQRARLREWLSRSSGYDLSNEDVALFDARYNHDNQYEVEVNFFGEKSKVMTFKYKGRYYTKKDRSIAGEYIINVKKQDESNS